MHGSISSPGPKSEGWTAKLLEISESTYNFTMARMNSVPGVLEFQGPKTPVQFSTQLLLIETVPPGHTLIVYIVIRLQHISRSHSDVGLLAPYISNIRATARGGAG